MMYGDMMYCKNCGNAFKDCWRGHDTRKENLLISNCPKCYSKHTMNADAFIEKYEAQDTQNRYSYTILYNHLKTLEEKFDLCRQKDRLPDIFLTKQEKINSNRKV